MSVHSLEVYLCEFNKVFLSIKPDAEEELEGGSSDPKTITYRIAKKKQENLERNNLINKSVIFVHDDGLLTL